MITINWRILSRLGFRHTGRVSRKPMGVVVEKKPESDRFVLGVDLDGVIADFYRGFKPIVAEWFGVRVRQLPQRFKYGLSEWGIKNRQQYDEIHRFAVTQRQLFTELQPVKGSPAILRRLSNLNIRIRIITHRLYIKYTHETAVRQTVEWLDRHGILYWDICFMKDKAAIGADLYIEDAPDNVKELRAAGNDTIVFSNPTNRGIGPPRADSWQDVEDLVSKKFKSWKRKQSQR